MEYLINLCRYYKKEDKVNIPLPCGNEFKQIRKLCLAMAEPLYPHLLLKIDKKRNLNSL